MLFHSILMNFNMYTKLCFILAFSHSENKDGRNQQDGFHFM